MQGSSRCLLVLMRGDVDAAKLKLQNPARVVVYETDTRSERTMMNNTSLWLDG